MPWRGTPSSLVGASSSPVSFFGWTRRCTSMPTSVRLPASGRGRGCGRCGAARDRFSWPSASRSISSSACAASRRPPGRTSMPFPRAPARESPTRGKRRRVCAPSSATRCASAAGTTIATISARPCSSKTITSWRAEAYGKRFIARAQPHLTPRRSSARSTRSSSSTRRWPLGPTSCCSTTCRLRRSCRPLRVHGAACSSKPRAVSPSSAWPSWLARGSTSSRWGR